MENGILNGVFEWINEDIKKIFLVYGITQKLTGLAAFRNGHIKIDRYKSQFEENLVLKFPEITSPQFDNLYNGLLEILDRDKVDIIEDLGRDKEEMIFDRYKVPISNFLINKTKRLNREHKSVIYGVIKSEIAIFELNNERVSFFEEKLKKFCQIDEFGVDFRDLLIKIGLVYKGTWITAKGRNNGINYQFPNYYQVLKHEILKILTTCPLCENKISPRAEKCPNCGDLIINFFF